MRKVVFAVATVILTAAPALAASPTFNWSGYYIGVNAGYSWGQGSNHITLGGSAFAPDQNATLDGFIGGGQFGYNWQANNWVYGLEVDFQGTGQKGNANVTCPGGTTTAVNSCTRGHVGDTVNDPALPVNVNLSERLEWLGTFRGRVGTTFTPMTLGYITGGLAYGQVRVTESVSGTDVNGVNGANGATFTPGGGSQSQNTVKVGWTAGVGVEGSLSGNWTGRIEYLYVDLGTVSGSFSTSLFAPGGAPLTAGYSSHITDNIVRVGINYVFHP